MRRLHGPIIGKNNYFRLHNSQNNSCDTQTVLTKVAFQVPALDSLLDADPSFPNSPQTVALIFSEANRDAPDLRKLCEWIGSDPALAARVLQMANSSRFRLCGQIATVSQALAVLAPGHIRSIAQAAAVRGTHSRVPSLEMRAFRRYSLNTAKVARALAGALHLNSGLAYTAGLVHALGELLILSQGEPLLTRLQERAAPLGRLRAKAEQGLLGYCHSDVIAGLARKWQWPALLVDALAHQHEPFGSDSCEPLAGVLHLAAWRAGMREEGVSGNALIVTFPDEVGVPLGLDMDAVLQQDPIDWHSRTAPPVWS